jgi:hypothetical protein
VEGPERDILVSPRVSATSDDATRSPAQTPTLFSCFNAFSRVDVRVDVKIPGGVDGERAAVAAAPVPQELTAGSLADHSLCHRSARRAVRRTSRDGLTSSCADSLLAHSCFRHETTAEIWQETYMSALLRAIRYADDPNYRLSGCLASRAARKSRLTTC